MGMLRITAVIYLLPPETQIYIRVSGDSPNKKFQGKAGEKKDEDIARYRHGGTQSCHDVKAYRIRSDGINTTMQRAKGWWDERTSRLAGHPESFRAPPFLGYS